MTEEQWKKRVLLNKIATNILVAGVIAVATLLFTAVIIDGYKKYSQIEVVDCDDCGPHEDGLADPIIVKDVKSFLE